MKKLVLLFFLILSISASAQNKLSPQARLFSQELNQLLSSEEGLIAPGSAHFYERYDIIQIKGSAYVGALLLVDANFDHGSFASHGFIKGGQVGQILSVRVRLHQFNQLVNLPGVQYIECGSTLEPNLERVRYSLRVDSVYMGLGDLSMPYTGKGVIVAIIDWGFDYTHPVFYDTLLQNYRVSRAWDQNKTSGPAPNGYTFGAEYIGKNALLAAGEDTLYVFGPGSHGTHVGGIAGGAGAQTPYKGMAPEAELIFISLRRDDASFIDAITYISRYAKSVNKPFVVNMSFGNHSGPHDGSTLRNRALDSLAGRGSVFVASAGNNGGEYFHLNENFQNKDTLISEVPNANGLANYWGESVNIWAEAAKSFSIQLELADAQNNPVYQSVWYATADNNSMYDTLFALDGDTLIIRLVSEDVNALNNKPNLLLESRNLGNKKLILRVIGSGNTHLWHVAQLNNRVTNWGQPFKSGYPGAVYGDAHYGIGGPPAVSKEVITVASYIAEAKLPNGQDALGQFSAYSSEGPTADERVKPDISAPGEGVLSSVNSFDPNPGMIVETVDFNGKTYSFVRYSGTSMSSPATVGVVALMLQANPNLTAREVKEILKVTARLDKHTGIIGAAGDLQWGWGKVNAYAAVRMAEIKTGGISIIENAPFSYYPNPVNNGQMTIESANPLKIRILDMQGREKKCQDLSEGNSILFLESLSSGAYLLEWQSGNNLGFEKIIISEF